MNLGGINKDISGGGGGSGATAAIRPTSVSTTSSFLQLLVSWFTGLALSGQGITYFDSALLVKIAQDQSNAYGSSLSMDLSDNALESTDAIMADLDNSGLANMDLQISGGTNAAPIDDVPAVPDTPALNYQNQAVLDGGTNVNNGDQWFVANASASGNDTVTYDNTIALAASSKDGSGNMTIGIIDTPTAIQIATKIESLGFQFNGIISRSGATLTIDSGSPDLSLYGGNVSGSPLISFNQTQAGQDFIPGTPAYNSHVANMVNNKGCIITTN